MHNFLKNIEEESLYLESNNNNIYTIQLSSNKKGEN